MKVVETGKENVTYEIDADGNLIERTSNDTSASKEANKATDLEQVREIIRKEIKSNTKASNTTYQIFTFAGDNVPTPAADMAGVDLPTGEGLNAATVELLAKTFNEYLRLAKKVAGNEVLVQKTPTADEEEEDFIQSFAVPSDKAELVDSILADYAMSQQTPIPYSVSEGQRFKGSIALNNPDETTLAEAKEAVKNDLANVIGAYERVTSKGNVFYSYVSEYEQELPLLTETVAKDRLAKPEPRNLRAQPADEKPEVPYLHSEVGSRVHEIADDSTYYPEYDYYHPNNARAVRQADASTDWNKRTWGGLREEGFITKPLFDGIAYVADGIKKVFSSDKDGVDTSDVAKSGGSKAVIVANAASNAAKAAFKELISLAKTATTSLAVIIGLLRGLVSFVGKEGEKVVKTSTDGMQLGLSYSRTAQANRADVLQGMKEGTTVNAYKTVYSKLTNPAVLDEKAINSVAAVMGLQTEDLVRFGTDGKKDISEITGLILDKFIQQSLAGKNSLDNYVGVTRAIGDNADTLASAFGSDIADIFMRIIESQLNDHGLYKLGSFNDYLNSADKDRGLKADAYGNSAIELDKLKSFNEELDRVIQALKNFGQHLAINLTDFLQPILTWFEDVMLSFAPADVKWEASTERIEKGREAGEKYRAKADAGKQVLMNAIENNPNLSDEDIAVLRNLSPEQLTGVLFSVATPQELGIKGTDNLKAVKRIRENKQFIKDRINMTANPLYQNAIAEIAVLTEYNEKMQMEEQKYAERKLVSSGTLSWGTDSAVATAIDKADNKTAIKIQTEDGRTFETKLGNAVLAVADYNNRTDTEAQKDVYINETIKYLKNPANLLGFVSADNKGASSIAIQMIALQRKLESLDKNTHLSEAKKKEEKTKLKDTAITNLLRDTTIQDYIKKNVLPKDIKPEDEAQARMDWLNSLVNNNFFSSKFFTDFYTGNISEDDTKINSEFEKHLLNIYKNIKPKAEATFKKQADAKQHAANAEMSSEKILNDSREKDRDSINFLQQYLPNIWNAWQEAFNEYGNTAQLNYTENANSSTANATVTVIVNGEQKVVSSGSARGKFTRSSELIFGYDDTGVMTLEKANIDALGK